MGSWSEEAAVAKLSAAGKAAFRKDQNEEVARKTAAGLKYSDWSDTSRRLQYSKYYQSM